MSLHAAELIISQVGLACEQPKVLGLDEDAPIPPLAADRAVAPRTPGAEVDIGLEADATAVTAAVIGLFHVVPFRDDRCVPFSPGASDFPFFGDHEDPA